MTRRELVTRMGEDELREWLVVDRIAPLEDGYWQAAMLAMVVSQTLGGNKKARLGDFLPCTGKPKRRQTPAEMAAVLGGVVAAVEAQKHA